MTAIFKEPAKGRIILRKLNLEGDRQADLRVHGGEYKAVYCYPLAHYDYWKKELLGRELPMGSFGENFTVDGLPAVGATGGLAEDSFHLGDQFSVGSAEVLITQARLPCYKLGVRFGSDDMVRRFMVSGRASTSPSHAREK
jgi:MOSC domain-containing protein YiiM